MKSTLIHIYNKLTDKQKVYKFTSVKSFCESEGYGYKVLAKAQEVEEIRPQIWNVREKPITVLHELSETYVAEVEDATVFGENDVIMSRGVVLSDVFTQKFADKMSLNKRIVKSINLERKEVELKYHNYRKLPIEEAFSLVGIFSFSYYHFLINLLPKLFYLYQCEEYKSCPLLVDRRAYENFKTIIDVFNIHNRPVICVGADTAFKVKRLIVSSNCVWYDRYVLEQFYDVTGHLYDKAAIQFVRNHVLSLVESKNDMKRVYVSRRKQGKERSRLDNEDAVEELFHKYGFITVYPEELSFLEQVKLFSRTSVFAGVSGAAFTNIIFLPENATIIIGTSVNNNRGENMFPSLWNAVGTGKYVLLLGQVTEETKNLKDNLRKFPLDTQEMEELLRSL